MAAGGLAALGVLAMTGEPGPALTPDSVQYLGAARSLVEEGTLRTPHLYDWWAADTLRPLSHYPPGLSVALAAPLLLGVPALESARVLMMVSAFVTVGIVVYVVSAAAGLFVAALVGTAVMMTAAIAMPHRFVWSEPLFLVVLVLTLACMVQRPRSPLLYGALTAMATMVRYAGIFVAPAVVLWAMLQPGSVRLRIRRGLLAALPIALTVGAWMVSRPRFTEGRLSAGMSDEPIAVLAEGFNTISRWLLPHAELVLGRMWRGPIIGALVVGLVALTVRELRRLRHASTDTARGDSIVAMRLVGAAAALAASYLLFVLVSTMVLDHRLALDDRMLAPGILLLEIGLAVVLAAWWRSLGARTRAAGAVAFIGWFCASALLTIRTTAAATEHLAMSASGGERGSALHWVRSAGRRHTLYSNSPEEIYLEADRVARFPPWHRDQMLPRVSTLRAFRDTLVRKRGALVLLRSADQRSTAWDHTLPRLLSLRMVRQSEDGEVWLPE